MRLVTDIQWYWCSHTVGQKCLFGGKFKSPYFLFWTWTDCRLSVYIFQLETFQLEVIQEWVKFRLVSVQTINLGNFKFLLFDRQIGHFCPLWAKAARRPSVRCSDFFGRQLAKVGALPTQPRVWFNYFRSTRLRLTTSIERSLKIDNLAEKKGAGKLVCTHRIRMNVKDRGDKGESERETKISIWTL